MPQKAPEAPVPRVDAASCRVLLLPPRPPNAARRRVYPRKHRSPQQEPLFSAPPPKPPYRQWTFRDLSRPLGGPALLILPDARVVAAGRLYDPKVRTALLWLDPATPSLRELLPLPSGGDTSYPGLVVHDGHLWVTYYSSHEGKTSIYLAKVKLPPGSAGLDATTRPQVPRP